MYSSALQDGVYTILKNKRQLTTPMGNPVTTQYKELADRLVEDLKRFGEDPSNPASLVAFHYAMIDFFSRLPRAELEANVALGLSKKHDWTLNCPGAAPDYMMKWMGLFGHPEHQTEQGKKWISTISLMQLAAVCVIGRGLESVNIPFLVATQLKKDSLHGFCIEASNYYPYISPQTMQRYLENYLFYFSLENKAI